MKYISFAAGWAIYFLVFILKKQGLLLPNLLQWYLTDLLCLPLLLSTGTILLRIYSKDKNYNLSLGMVLFAIAYISLTFEYILPQYNPSYTADLNDIWCYFSGGMLFYMIQRSNFGAFSKTKKILLHAESIQ